MSEDVYGMNDLVDALRFIGSGAELGKVIEEARTSGVETASG
jgi:hypothetical protein